MTLYLLLGLAAALVYAAWRWHRSGRIEAERDALSRAVEAEQSRRDTDVEVARMSDVDLDRELSGWLRPGDDVRGVEADLPVSTGQARQRDG